MMTMTVMMRGMAPTMALRQMGEEPAVVGAADWPDVALARIDPTPTATGTPPAAHREEVSADANVLR